MAKPVPKEAPLSEAAVRRLSAARKEPAWLLDIRLAGLAALKRLPWPEDVPCLSELRLEEVLAPRFSPAEGRSRELEKQGVLFLDWPTALRRHPDLVRERFAAIVMPGQSPSAALNAAFWSGGTFVHVPEGVKVELPLQALARIEGARAWQLERTMIVAEAGSEVRFIEGCTARPGAAFLHGGVVEVWAGPRARVGYTTLQYWADSVYNLAAKRAVAEAGARIDWLDVNLGSRLTVKHPSVTLAGEGASAEILSCALASGGRRQDIGGELVFAAPNTQGCLRSRLAVKDGGTACWRSAVRVLPQARGASATTSCEVLVLDGRSRFDSYPRVEIEGEGVRLDQKSRVSGPPADELFYLRSRGLGQTQAAALLLEGFFEPFARALPLEYSVEFLRLLDLESAPRL